MASDDSKKSKRIEQRHLVEKAYHDKKFKASNSSPFHYKVNPTYRIFKEIKNNMGLVKGKRLLECGCGTGWITLELAAMGARVESFDISAEAIRKTSDLLKKNDLEKQCVLNVMSAESLNYPQNSFDIILGFAILHHLDLSLALPELYRVLKPGGVAYFAEPLGHNPFINIYRKLTPSYRTPDEQPLRFDTFFKLTSEFQNVQHNEHYLTAILPFFLLYIPILNVLYPVASDFLIAVDQLLLSRFPKLGKWAWYSIIELHK